MNLVASTSERSLLTCGLLRTPIGAWFGRMEIPGIAIAPVLWHADRQDPTLERLLTLSRPREVVERALVLSMTTMTSAVSAQATAPVESQAHPSPSRSAEAPGDASSSDRRIAEASPPNAGSDADTPAKITPLGYVEAYYAYNLNRPSNGITNFRGFDNRHNTFTLANAALGGNFESGSVGGRLILQIGSTPSTYYQSEPELAGASGANASGAALWKYLQEAFITYRAPIGRGLRFQLGLAASPIGLEVFAVKDNWNWSRSNLFFGLPYYHTGLRATYELTDELSATVGVFNGWNSVVDNNAQKSLQGSLTYKFKDQLSLQALYFGGVERPPGAPEGAPWRHHFDAFARYDASDWLSLAAEADYGWESNRVGVADWAAGALYARLNPIDRLYIAIRGDRFHENVAVANGASSAPLFFGGVQWVSSGTITLDVRPHDQASVRLEYRHDDASGPLYFKGAVEGGGSTAPYVVNASTQDTVLVGATTWF